MKRSMVAAVLALVGLVATVRAAESDGPKDALKTFMTAIVAGDVDAAQAIAYTQTDEQKEVVSVMAGLMKAATNFEAAAKEKYGDAAKPITEGFKQGQTQIQNEMKKLDEAEVKIEGDVATITVKGETKPAKAKKVDGKWKVDITTMPEMPSAQDVANLKKLIAAMNDVTAGIKEGKYKTVEEMAQALAAKMGGQ